MLFAGFAKKKTPTTGQPSSKLTVTTAVDLHRFAQRFLFVNFTNKTLRTELYLAFHGIIFHLHLDFPEIAGDETLPKSYLLGS